MLSNTEASIWTGFDQFQRSVAGAPDRARGRAREVLIKVFHADVNRRSSSDGDTALHRAACTGRPDICRMLWVMAAPPERPILAGMFSYPKSCSRHVPESC